MKQDFSKIKNDKPFCLLILTHGTNEEYKKYEYPSLNLGMVLAKVKEHIKNYVTETELQQILQGLIENNCDMKVEWEDFRVYVFELAAKDLYKPRKITNE